MEQLPSRHILPKENNAVVAYAAENLSAMTMAVVAPVLGGLATGNELIMQVLNITVDHG